MDSHGATLYSRSAWYFQQREQPPPQPVKFTSRRSPSDLAWSEEVEAAKLANVPPSCCLRDDDGLDYVNLTACQFGQLDPMGNPYLNVQVCEEMSNFSLHSICFGSIFALHSIRICNGSDYLGFS